MFLENFKIEKQVEGMEMRYEYNLTLSDYHNQKVYGVSVSREYIKEGEVVDRYEDSIKYISPIKEKVIDLLQTLYKWEVSPIHLVDVAGEYVDNCVNDFSVLEQSVN